MIDDESLLFECGDVVYGDDPFNGDETARPWLVLSNHEGRPFQGDQSIDHEDIDVWQGRLDSDIIDRAVAALVEELQ